MKIYNLLLLPAILIAFCLTGFAQSVSEKDISEEKLKNHLLFLASDSLTGRGTGSPELNIAAEYLKEHLQKLNLTSSGGQFFQPFILTSNTFDRENSFLSSINSRGRKKKTVKNFIPVNQNIKVIDVEGELAFAGFGLSSLFAQNSDEHEKQIKGKVVMYSAGSPESLSLKTAQQWNSALERNKMDEFFKAGAKALIVVTNVQDTANTNYRHIEQRTLRKNLSLYPKEEKELRKIFITTPQTADKLIGKKLIWEKTLRAVSKDEPYNSFTPKSKKVHIRSVLKEKRVEAKNVIGIIEGSDSLLRKECIVFVAHYDHLGTTGNGEIYNGADDNASGVATLLEVARMFSCLPVKPKRSIVFLFPTAEEIGLYGSEYYSLNPVFPMGKTVACINLDMVGRVYEQRDSIMKRSLKQVKDFNGIYTLVNDFNPDLKDITLEACSKLDMEPDFSLPGRFFYSSDHYHFHKNKVPILNISTGYSADYHQPTDTASRIRTDKMKRVAQLCFQVGTELGNKEN